MSFLPKHRVWIKGLKQVRIAEKRRGKVPQWRGTRLQHCPVEAEEAKSVCVQRERGPGWVGESEAGSLRCPSRSRGTGCRPSP